MSAPTARTRPPPCPSSSAARWSASCPRAAIVTEAPAPTNASAMPRPIPLLPPVTMATLPSKLNSGIAFGMSRSSRRIDEMRRKPQPGPELHGRADDPWRPGVHSRDELARALVHGCVAGLVTSHDRSNVRWKLERLVAGDPDLQFGLTGLDQLSFDEVLGLMADAAGFDPAPETRLGPVSIDPERVLSACEAAGRRLAEAAERGERLLIATGHPSGLLLLYAAVAELLVEAGAKLLTPHDG